MVTCTRRQSSLADGPTNRDDPARPSITVNPAPASPVGNAALQRINNEAGTISGVMVGWQTMFPPPDFVRGYGEAVENGSERFFRQFELEAEHRRQMDRERLGNQTKQLSFVRSERRLSQWLAGVYAFGALLLAAYLAHKGSPGYAATVATTSIASVVAAFLAFGRQTITAKQEPTVPPSTPSKRVTTKGRGRLGNQAAATPSADAPPPDKEAPPL